VVIGFALMRGGPFGPPILAHSNLSTAFSLLDGQADERTIARVSALMENPDVAKALERSMQRDAATAKRQQGLDRPPAVND
jgi:hypothetical protein